MALRRPGPGEVKLREFRREARADGSHLHHGLGRAGLQHRDPGSALLEPEYGGGLGRWPNSDAPPALRSRPLSARPLRGSRKAGWSLRGAPSPAPAPRPLVDGGSFCSTPGSQGPCSASLCSWRPFEVHSNSFVLDSRSSFSSVARPTLHFCRPIGFLGEPLVLRKAEGLSKPSPALLSSPWQWLTERSVRLGSELC